MAYPGALEVQNGQQNSTPMEEDTPKAVDTDIPKAANGTARDMPDENSMEEDAKMDGLINGQNGDVVLVNSNGEVDKEVSRHDENDPQPESNSNERTTLEE